MNRPKLFAAFLIFVLCASVVPAFAADVSIDSNGPVLVPGHPLYFMKQFKEGMQYAFTFNTEKKFALQEKFIVERQREYIVLERNGDTANMLRIQQMFQTHNVISTNLRTQIGTCNGNC